MPDGDDWKKTGNSSVGAGVGLRDDSGVVESSLYPSGLAAVACTTVEWVLQVPSPQPSPAISVTYRCHVAEPLTPGALIGSPPHEVTLGSVPYAPPLW